MFPKGLWAAVLILDEDGKPVEGAIVEPKVDWIQGYFKTDVEGKGWIGPLRPGRTQSKVSGFRGFAEVRAEVDPEIPLNVIRVEWKGPVHSAPPPSEPERR